MTVTNSIAYSNLVSGNGVTTAFPTQFQFQKNSDVEVVLIDALGVEHIQVENTNYTLTGEDNPAGGTVTFLIAPAANQKVRSRRIVPFTQETHYTEGTAFPALTHEEALDHGVMLSQDLKASIDRAPRLKFSSSLYPLEFPDGGNANKGNLIRWNTVDGTTLEAVSATDAALTAVLNPVDGGFIVGDGTDFVVEQGATARTSLGLGSMAIQDGSNITVTGGAISNTATTLKDSGFTIQANADATKQVRLDASAITTGNTRTLTVPNKNGTLAVTTDINNAPLTTKGDVLTYDTALARLPVGLNGQLLTADSTAATGVSWQTPSGAGDVAGPASSADSEVALFSGTSGKLIKRATGTGFAKLTSGVLSASATVNLATEAAGNLAVARLNSGTNASGTTFWRGDGTWATPLMGLVQSVSSNLTTASMFSVVGATWYDSGLAVTITPTSAANRILILAQICASPNVSNTSMAYTRLARGASTGINVATDARINQLAGTMPLTVNPGNDGYVGFTSISYIDSPATNAAITYKVQIGAYTSTTMHVNRSGTDVAATGYIRYASTITAIELSV